MVQDIQDGNVESLEDLIEVKKNKPNADYKYSAWLGPWPCDIDGDSQEQAKLVTVDLLNVIIDQIMGAYTENNVYGLTVYACGWDGQAQTDFRKYYADEYGVDVF